METFQAMLGKIETDCQVMPELKLQIVLSNIINVYQSYQEILKLYWARPKSYIRVTKKDFKHH